MILKFWTDDSGATAIEYGLIAAGIALAIIRRERTGHHHERQVHFD
jgi:Flp pilus assembly pilin Flp